MERHKSNVVDSKLEEHMKYLRISVLRLDGAGNEVLTRLTVPVIREKKETSFRIVKRKRMVTKLVNRGKKKVMEEVEEEYDACMKVETVTQTVQIRDVQENGEVVITEQDIVNEYFIGKERKYKYVKVEKKLEDGTIEEVDEIEVEEEESEEEKPHRGRKKKYDSKVESIGEGDEADEWAGEEEGRAREEFSAIEEEVYVMPAVEEGYKAEEIKPEEKEWKAMDELIEEVEAEAMSEEVEEEDMLPWETLLERELRKKKVFFFKLTKMFFGEIEKRKTVMRDFKKTCRCKGMKIISDKTHQEFIDEEAAEVEALMNHLRKVYAKYIEEEEEVYKKENADSRKVVKLPWEEINDEELKLIRQAAKKLLKGMPKLIHYTLKYEELLSKKDQPVKDNIQKNIDSIKDTLLAGIKQRDILDKKKNEDALAKKLETGKKKNAKTIKNFVCKKREANFEFEKTKSRELKKNVGEELNYLKLKKPHSDKIRGAEPKLLLGVDEDRTYPELKDILARNKQRPPKDKPMKTIFCKMKGTLHGETSESKSP